MRKKHILGVILILIMIGSVAFLSCGKKSNPVTAKFDAGIVSGQEYPTVYSAATLSDDTTFYGGMAHDEIQIVFSKPMDPSTINTTNIQLWNPRTRTQYSGYVVTYQPEAQKAVVTGPLANGAWDTLSVYLLVVKSAVTDISGNPLDGNGNVLYSEGSPYDDWKDDFYGAQWRAGGPSNVDLQPPTVSHSPTNNQKDVQTTDSIQIWISDNDSVDESTLTSDKFFIFADNNPTVNLVSNFVRTDSGAVNGNRRKISFSGYLQEKTIYHVVVKTGIKDIKGNTLDGNGNTRTEGDTLDAERFTFQTIWSGGNTVAPVVTNARKTDSDDGIHYTTISVLFNKEMDPATLNSTNVRLYKNAGPPPTNYIPGTITVYYNKRGFTYSLQNDPDQGSGALTLWLSKDIKDSYGFGLDGNGNGIGGESANYTNGWNSDDWENSDWPYSDLNSDSTIVFFDNVEGGSGGWTRKGTGIQVNWHRTTHNAYSGIYSWYCGKENFWNYDDSIGGAKHDFSDTLVSSSISLLGFSDVDLNYARYYNIEGGDTAMVLVSTDGGATWNAIDGYNGSGGWAIRNRPLNNYVGRNIRLAFVLTADNLNNTQEGSYVDDIEVKAWP
ncbi:MAG: Ig-like domain-containing protein [Candidatus Edwardsbacteria bacterium]